MYIKQASQGLQGLCAPKISLESLDTRMSLVFKNSNPTNEFFSRRNSKGSSCKSSNKSSKSNKSSHIEEGFSNEACLKVIGKQNNNLKNFEEKGHLAVTKKYSPQFLPALTKELSSDQKNLQENLQTFKEKAIKPIKIGNYQQILSLNQRSNSDCKVKGLSKTKRCQQKQNGNQRMSSFAKSPGRFRNRRTLEQATIDDVLLYDQKHNFHDLRESDHSDDDEPQNDGALSPLIKRKAKKNFLIGHDITDEQRSRMIDWMVQVFRVLKVSSATTFFMAVSIMDRYCQAMQKQEKKIQKEDLYLIGLVCIFISSKVEDVVPIRMIQILDDAGHFRFNQLEILMMEKHILEVLKFDVFQKNVYNEAALIFKDIIFAQKMSPLPKDDLDIAMEYLLFISQVSVYDIDVCLLPQNLFTLVIMKQTLGFLKRRVQFKKANQSDSLLQDSLKNDLQKILDMKFELEQKYIDILSAKDRTYLKAINNVFKKYIRNNDNIDSKKNLIRNFPQFVGDDVPPYIFIGFKPIVMNMM